MTYGLVMFSGGLDSVIASHLLKSQGLSIKALHFVLPFYSGLGLSHQTIKDYAAALDIPLRIEEEGEEFLEMIRDPKFGFGKNANPCIDCRMHRLKRAEKIMESEGASFIATGEVIGQRPMSQRLDCLYKIERGAGLKGILLRPLSAKLLHPTKPEIDGLVNREKLLNISGRSRRRQLEYARTHGLLHSAPAGGCMLTNVDPARRFLEMVHLNPQFELGDFKLLAYGRHFRISPEFKIAVSRFDSENYALERIAAPGDYSFQMAETTGPLGIGRGCGVFLQLELAASLLARYSRFRNNEEVKVEIKHNGKSRTVKVKPADDRYM